ncbi:MAG: M48 family metalloprotease [Chloroflexota bacterium]
MIGTSRQAGTGGRGISGRLIVALIVALISIVGYFGARQVNPVTNETQNISMTVEQEIGLGRQAAPELAAQYGGQTQNAELQATVERVGGALVQQSEASAAPYPFEFHVLADQQTINAFALPGGQVFVTEGLLQLLETEGELAGVLAHEIFHVVGRHSAEQVARAQLAEGLTGAAVIAAYDPNDPSSAQSAQVALLVGQVVNMRFGREDELESDHEGVSYMAAAGYDPRAMVSVMQKLNQANEGAQPPEFLSTHPDPERRIERIEEAIAAQFPNGVPEDLKD